VPKVLDEAYRERCCVVGTLITHPLLEAATDTRPDPAIDRVRASYVPELVPNVLDEAYRLLAGATWTMNPEFEAATETRPEPLIDSVLASYVPLEVPNVLSAAYTLPAWLLCAKVALAVIVETFIPKLTLFEFDQTTVPALTDDPFAEAAIPPPAPPDPESTMDPAEAPTEMLPIPAMVKLRASIVVLDAAPVV
jgi:hypothetical protein